MTRGKISAKAYVFAIAAVFIIMLAVVGIVIYLETISDDDTHGLVIISYTSFEQWGLGPETVKIFEEMYGVNVTLKTNFGDVGQVLSALDKGEYADLVIGIDNSMLRTALKLDLLDVYRPDNIDRVDPDLIFDPEFHIVPYDYGYLAVICNTVMMEERDLPYPESIMNLSQDVYKDQIMFIDPATSSTGSSFLIWAASVSGEGLGEYLEDLSESEFNVFPTWDGMYNAFQNGEAPIGISYGLDTASDHLFTGSSTTVTIVPENEGYRQIEGAGILKGARNRDMAEEFIEFMLTDDFQSRVGYNVMLPVVPGTPVDPIYLEHGVWAREHVEPTQEVVREYYPDWFSSWEDAFY